MKNLQIITVLFFVTLLANCSMSERTAQETQTATAPNEPVSSHSDNPSDNSQELEFVHPSLAALYECLNAQPSSLVPKEDVSLLPQYASLELAVAKRISDELISFVRSFAGKPSGLKCTDTNGDGITNLGDVLVLRSILNP